MESTWYQPRWPRRCQIDECGASAWRTCRVCLRWACRVHRFGAGHWWRCVYCPAPELHAIRRDHRRQELEERLRRCLTCGAAWRMGLTLRLYPTWHPTCGCHLTAEELQCPGRSISVQSQK